MKNTGLVLLVVLCCGATDLFSQKKNLTIQDAVLKGRTTLAPKRLQNLGFISDSKRLTYVDNNELIIVDPESGKVLTSLNSVGFNKNLAAGGIDTISGYQNIKWKSDNEFYFRGKND